MESSRIPSRNKLLVQATYPASKKTIKTVTPEYVCLIFSSTSDLNNKVMAWNIKYGIFRNSVLTSTVKSIILCSTSIMETAKLMTRPYYSLLISHIKVQLQNYNFFVKDFSFHVLNPLLLYFLHLFN